MLPFALTLLFFVAGMGTVIGVAALSAAGRLADRDQAVRRTIDALVSVDGAARAGDGVVVPVDGGAILVRPALVRTGLELLPGASLVFTPTGPASRLAFTVEASPGHAITAGLPRARVTTSDGAAVARAFSSPERVDGLVELLARAVLTRFARDDAGAVSVELLVDETAAAIVGVMDLLPRVARGLAAAEQSGAIDLVARGGALDAPSSPSGQPLPVPVRLGGAVSRARNG